MSKYKKCTNCKHPEVSYYKRTVTNTLPDVLVGACKIPFCECTGFSPVAPATAATRTTKDSLGIVDNPSSPPDQGPNEPDKERQAHRDLLFGEWKSPTVDKQLRYIIQYAQSGRHYPADMHVGLIKEVYDAHIRRVTLEAQLRQLYKDRNAAADRRNIKNSEDRHKLCNLCTEDIAAITKELQEIEGEQHE